MVEDVAHTVFVAEQLGRTEALPPSEVEANHSRYRDRYGTHAASLGVKR
jgi:L-ribulose-5-phosphate 4-epimerase